MDRPFEVEAQIMKRRHINLLHIVKLHNHRFYSSALIETTPPNLVVLKVFYYSLLCLVTFLNTTKLHDVDTSLVTADLSVDDDGFCYKRVLCRILLSLLYIEKF